MSKTRGALLVLWGGLVFVSGAAVLYYAAKHPGPAAGALVVAWLIPGVPPPGPFGRAAGPRATA